MKRDCVQVCASLLTRIALAAAVAPALAGPPFRTDDPVPVPHRAGEAYVFSSGTHDVDGWSGVGPAFELNYGILPEAQLHLVMPMAYDAPGGARDHVGYGDTEVGIKYRLLQQTESLPEIGVFPLVEIPTGDEGRGLGNGQAQYFLPVWLQKDFGDGRWTSYGGGGYWINPGRDNQNWWFTGALLQRNFETFFIGAEMFHATADTEHGHASTGFNLGGGVHLAREFQLLWSAGSGIENRDDNRFSYYLGLYRAF